MGGGRLTPWLTAYLALGSNLGDRLDHLREAALNLAGMAGVRVVAASAIYRTEPVGPADQPDYANQVLRVETALPPEALLAAAITTERRAGRTRERPDGPRTLDVDLLFFGEEIIARQQLVVPHPRLHRRRFVLVPMAELDPDFVHPVLKRTMAELLATLADPHRVAPWS